MGTTPPKTQMAIVKLQDENFIFLDCCDVLPIVKRQIDTLVGDRLVGVKQIILRLFYSFCSLFYYFIFSQNAELYLQNIRVLNGSSNLSTTLACLISIFITER